MMHEPIELPADAPARPRSAVSPWVGMVGVAGLGAWTILCHHVGLNGPYAALIAVIAAAVPMVGWSLLVDRVHRNPSTGIDWANPRPWRAALVTALPKLAGLWATWGLVACAYAVARWYWQPPYLLAMETLTTLLPILLVLSVPYVLWLDRVVVEPRDGCWHFGRAVLGHDWRAPPVRAAIAGHLRSWGVKGFFTAFMVSTLPGNWYAVMAIDPGRWLDDPVVLGDNLVNLMFLVDVMIATVGYLVTMRPLDSHIRSANPYAAAWLAALICYPPFVLMNAGGPLDYAPDFHNYETWLAGWPALVAINAFALIALTGIYAWATIAFGLRFSNLTHRGILTNGPYAWTKHPAYLSKNLFWWLAAMPFLASAPGWAEAIRNTAILALVSGVYYWRARTEERHLSADPDYVAYAGWAATGAPVTRLLRRITG